MENLKHLRNKIDKVDEKIQTLLNKRASIALRIGKEKSKNNIKILRCPEREAQILKTIIKRNKGPLKNKDLKNIYKKIINCCLLLQKKECKP